MPTSTSSTEPLQNPRHDALHRPGSYVLPRFGGSKDIGTTINSVSDVSLAFEPPKDCPNGGFLGLAAQLRPHLIGRDFVRIPDDLHDLELKLAEVRHTSFMECGPYCYAM